MADVAIYTEYANGAIGVFITSTGDCSETNKLEITGTAVESELVKNDM